MFALLMTKYTCRPDRDGATPLIIAAENGRLEVVRLLLSMGARLDAQAQDGTCAVSCASHAVRFYFSCFYVLATDLVHVSKELRRDSKAQTAKHRQTVTDSR